MKIITNKTTYGETIEQQTDNKQITTNKNDKNEKNDKETKEEEEEKGNSNCISFYMENINPLITPNEAETLKNYCEDLSDDIITYAIQEAIDHNARNMAYIKTILNRYVNEGIKTVEQLKMQENIKKQTEIKKETLEEQIERYKKEWGLTDED